jgi:predicted transcriptional regulator
VYITIDRTELKKRLEQCIENWHDKMRQALSKFGEGF